MLHVDRFPFLHGRDRQPYLRDGARWAWIDDDSQTFMMLRFLVPAIMGHRGRAVPLDPDMLVLGDIAELLRRDMGDKAILCRETRGDGKRHSSIPMLLDCAKLRHWDAERDFAAFFTFERDHDLMMRLQYDNPATIGFFEDVWNDHDRLAPDTKILHLTSQRHQPWKTGLPIRHHVGGPPPRGWWDSGQPSRSLFGDGRYEPHPDPRQERLFFGLLRECVENGAVAESALREAMARDDLRHDALDLIARARPEDVPPPRRSTGFRR
jgi:hypothetical protein